MERTPCNRPKPRRPHRDVPPRDPGCQQPKHRTPQIPKPVEEQLALVGMPLGNSTPALLIGASPHHRVPIPPASSRDPQRQFLAGMWMFEIDPDGEEIPP